MKLQTKEPEKALLADIVMPEKERIETIREFRRRFPKIRIVAMSGGSQRAVLTPEEYLEMAVRMGADTALPKPFATAGLRAAHGLPASE